jgi:hypothetical protein
MLYEPEAIGPKAYAPVGARRDNLIFSFSAIFAISAVNYYEE